MIRSSGSKVWENAEDPRPPSRGVVLKIFIYTLQYKQKDPIPLFEKAIRRFTTRCEHMSKVTQPYTWVLARTSRLPIRILAYHRVVPPHSRLNEKGPKVVRVWKVNRSYPIAQCRISTPLMRVSLPTALPAIGGRSHETHDGARPRLQ